MPPVIFGTDAISACVYGCDGLSNTSATGPHSTIRPAYITATRSHIRATTPKSCVMNRIAIPVSRCRRFSSFRYCSWIVTSSAVVGSSAISTSGWPLIAIAPTTRCFMPPLIWCGNWPSRCSGAEISTCRSAATASFMTSALPRRPRRRAIASRSWSPIVNTGFSEVCGSCRIIEIRLPRISRISFGVRCRMSSPFSSTWPPRVLAPPFGNSRMIDSAVRLLPQPDSPTRPRTSPRRSEKLTPSTALRSRGAEEYVRGRGHRGRCRPLPACGRGARGRPVRPLPWPPAAASRPGGIGGCLQLAHSWRSLGSSRSRSQSPNTLTDSTNSVIAMPGISDTHQAS